MLHIHGGSILLEKLAQAGVPGERLEWAEVLCQGPTPRGLSDDAWYDLRAEFLTGTYGPTVNRDVRAKLVEQDQALGRAAAQDELVLWFGPELFCQAILVRILARLAERPPERTRLSLVSVDSYPGVDDHNGCTLGALSGAQLADLFEKRAGVTTQQLALARRAWDAMTAPTPEPLAALVREQTPALPFLNAALRRLLAELPDLETGLSRTERLLLDALPVRRGLDAFVPTSAPEPRRWITDTIFYDHVRRLARTPHALIAVGANDSGTDDLGHSELGRTPAADDVRAGRRDAVALRGIDRWVGGTHLTADNFWRWDEGKSQVVRG